MNFALSGVLFVLSLYFQETRGYSPSSTGLAFLPLTIPTVFNPIFTGRLVARIGPRVPAVSGFLLMSGGTLVQAFAPALSVVALALLGFGVSLAVPSLLTALFGSLLNVTTTAVALVVVSALLLAGASIVVGSRA